MTLFFLWIGPVWSIKDQMDERKAVNNFVNKGDIRYCKLYGACQGRYGRNFKKKKSWSIMIKSRNTNISMGEFRPMLKTFYWGNRQFNRPWYRKIKCIYSKQHKMFSLHCPRYFLLQPVQNLQVDAKQTPQGLTKSDLISLWAWFWKV